MHHNGLIIDLAIVCVVAAATALLARRLRQPTVLGYLFAGLLVGPYIPIPLFADPGRMKELAEVGVVLVMFAVGLEFRIRRFIDILPQSGLAAAVQMGALSWAGITVGTLMGWSTAASVCLGASIAISSTMVVSAVLRTVAVDNDVRSHVFGILVVQDVVAIVLIAVVTALAAGAELDVRALGWLVGQLAAVVVGILVLGVLVLPRIVHHALGYDLEVLVVVVVGAAFGVAVLAEQFGYSVALGAFLAGMAVAESGQGHVVEKAIEPLRAVFSAIFFVSIGMAVDPRVALQTFPLAAGLVAVVIVMQLVGVTTGTVLTGSDLRRGVLSGLALGQVGELSFILATIAIGGGVVPPTTLSTLVLVATMTAFTTPLLLKHGQRVAHAVDRALPTRVHNVLLAHQAFLLSLRADGKSAFLKTSLVALLLDWAALVLVFVINQVLHGAAATRDWQESSTLWFDVGSVVLASPFVLGLLRSGRRLTQQASERVRAQHGSRRQARAVETALLAGVGLGVGLPTLALLAPVIDGPWLEAGGLVVLLVALVGLGSRVGHMDGPMTSGVGRFASDVAAHLQAQRDRGAPPQTSDAVHGDVDAPDASPDSEMTDVSPWVDGHHPPLVGLDYTMVTVADDSVVVGDSLADLDLRCQTGATVVAIMRGEELQQLPSGQERLQCGDGVALTGTAESVERAIAVLETTHTSASTADATAEQTSPP